jgi:hypothetical protein
VRWERDGRVLVLMMVLMLAMTTWKLMERLCWLRQEQRQVLGY